MSPSGPSPLVFCRDLVKRFGSRLAVDGVSFEIAPGETYGLLGPNGAGKTTTISMVCGLLARDGGEVVVDEHPMDERHAAAKAAVGYVPQELALYPDLTARENLEFFGRLYGLRGRNLGSRVDDVLETIGLGDRATDRVEHYSGGMKRRLNIGAGLLHEPRLLVLDEPTVGVDPQSRNAILESVETLGSGGMAVLYTTHYMEEAERLCDRIGILDEGRLLAEGSRAELVAMIGEHTRVHLTGSGDLEALARGAGNVEGVRDAALQDGGVEILVDDPGRLLPRLVQTALDTGAVVTSIEVEEPDLEAVFLHLTGKALRD